METAQEILVGDGMMFCHTFIKAENQERGKSEFHGVGGPLSVSDQRIHLPLLDEFQNAAEEFGIPKTNDFNTGEQSWMWLFSSNTKRWF